MQNETTKENGAEQAVNPTPASVNFNFNINITEEVILLVVAAALQQVLRANKFANTEEFIHNGSKEQSPS